MSPSSGKIQEQITSFIDDKIVPLDLSKKIGIWLAALLIPCLAFYFLYYTGKTEEIEKLEKQQSRLESDLARVKKRSRKIKEHKAEMKEVKTMFDMAARLLPEKQEIPSLLTSISEIGRSSGLDFHSFTPQKERKKRFYAEIPVNIKVQCSYHEAGVFLDKISNLDRIVTVSNLSMGGAKNKGGKNKEGNMMLNTSFRLITYRFLNSSGKK
ncbi:MAG: type 4a pilus biogenesis protein PilO [Desulfurivibrionaceae bacterium]